MEVGWSTLRVWRWRGHWSTAGVRLLAEEGAELLDQVCQRREITRDLVYRSLVEVQAAVDVEDFAGETTTDFCFSFCLFLCRLEEGSFFGGAIQAVLGSSFDD
jgi:hypothetical protein